MSSEDLDGLKPRQFLAKFTKSDQPAQVLEFWKGIDVKQAHGLSESFLYVACSLNASIGSCRLAWNFVV